MTISIFIDIRVIVISILTVLFLGSARPWVVRFSKTAPAKREDLEVDKHFEVREAFTPSPTKKRPDKVTPRKAPNYSDCSSSAYKSLYHKVQNLEKHPDILEECWKTLIAFLNEAVSHANQTQAPGILSVKQYNFAAVSAFQHDQEAAISEEWERYLRKRKAGSPRELFATKEDAIVWLKTKAPVKYVDGAWLGHVHKISTPFRLRHVTKDAWQVLSEELGDGDLGKNHVYVYAQLLNSVGIYLPKGDSVEFTYDSLGLNDIATWRAALTQLLISLFPHDFLPEILGFNLHFELLTRETLVASKELKELNIDPYYFVLHITIDNADSGHSALALQAVHKYLEHILQSEGAEAAHKAWKRVQAGYVLSNFAGVQQTRPEWNPTDLEAQVLHIFKSKAPVAHKIHRSSTLQIGRYTLAEWLRPEQWATVEHQRAFMLDLRNARPWVYPGESQRSKFIKELQWGGKMFGAFTQRETRVLERWIDSQPSTNTQAEDAYWSFIGLNERALRQNYTSKSDICADYPVISAMRSPTLQKQETDSPSPGPRLPFEPLGKLTPTHNTDISAFLSLWFTHPCLLETPIAVPSQTTTPIACAIVRLLRAQYGFNPESSGVDGMDEAIRTDNIGIIELGFEIAQISGQPKPASVKQALEWWPSDFATGLLHLGMRPLEKLDELLGLTWAFVELHQGVAVAGEGCQAQMLSDRGKVLLVDIASREEIALRACLHEMEKEGKKVSKEFRSGYFRGRKAIQRIL